MPWLIRHWTNLELRVYLKILKKNILFILLFAAFGAVAAFMFTLKLASGVRFEQYFYLVSSNNPGSQAQPAENSTYFSQEAARNFTDTAIAILSSPDFISEISLGNGQIAVRKMAPQVIKLTATASQEGTAKSLIEKTTSSFNQKILSLAGDQIVSLKPVGRGAQPVALAPNRSLIVIFGLLSGSVFALLVVGLKIYFKV